MILNDEAFQNIKIIITYNYYTRIIELVHKELTLMLINNNDNNNIK